MALAKICHASNIINDLAKATHIATTKKLSESPCFNNLFIIVLEENLIPS